VAFLRREDQMPGLAFRFLTKEPLVVILPSDHRLATHDTIRRKTSHAKRSSVFPRRRHLLSGLSSDDYAARTGIDLIQTTKSIIFSMAVSMIVSTRGFALQRYDLCAKSFPHRDRVTRRGHAWIRSSRPAIENIIDFVVWSKIDSGARRIVVDDSPESR